MMENSSINENYINTENDNDIVVHSDGLAYKDRSNEFIKKRQKYVAKLNSDISAITLKFKQVTMNVSTLLQPEIESKVIKNCLVCGIVFGKIFSKKQRCIVCGYVVCSNCNNHPIPINSFDKSKSPVQDSKSQNINVCLLCFKTLTKAIQRAEFQAMKQRIASSGFVMFYEQLHLNSKDLVRNANQYKLIVNSIQDSGSPQIKRAKELEANVNICIKDLKAGILKLKGIKAESQRQATILFNINHCCMVILNEVVPSFKVSATDFQAKLQIPPSSSPRDIGTLSKSGSANTSTNSLKEIFTSHSSNNGSTPNSPERESTSPQLTTRISSFFSNVLNFSNDKAIQSNSSNNQNNNSHNQNTNHQNNDNTQQTSKYENSPDKAFILSVGPAVCALSGSYIAIQGENLEKKTIKVFIGGEDINPIKRNFYSILLVGPKRTTEGEVEIVIKDKDHVLSNQTIFYTNSCFQTEKDIKDINTYAIGLYESASPSMSYQKKKQQQHLMAAPDDTDEDIFLNDVKTQLEEMNNQPYSINEDDHINYGINNTNGTSKKNNSNVVENVIASTGNTLDDLIILEISPVVSPMNGTRININLKYALVAPVVVSISGMPVQRIEMTNQRRTVSFQSPPSLREGFHTIELMYNDKYLEVPNILVYYNAVIEEPTETIQAKSITTTSNYPNNTVNNIPIISSNPSINIVKSTPLNSSSNINRSSRVWGKG